MKLRTQRSRLALVYRTPRPPDRVVRLEEQDGVRNGDDPSVGRRRLELTSQPAKSAWLHEMSDAIRDRTVPTDQVPNTTHPQYRRTLQGMRRDEATESLEIAVADLSRSSRTREGAAWRLALISARIGSTMWLVFFRERYRQNLDLLPGNCKMPQPD